MKSETKSAKILKKPETDSHLNPRVGALLRRFHTFAGLRLQPLTAGRLVTLQITQNRFLFLTGRIDDALVEAGRWGDLHAQIGAFLFALSATPDDISTAICEKRKNFGRVALAFYKTLSPKQTKQAVDQIVKILFEIASEDGEVIASPESQFPKENQNSPDPTWLISYVLDIAMRTGWHHDYIVWDLPLAVGSQLRHACQIQNTTPFPSPPQSAQEAESLAELQSQLRAIKNA